MNKIHVLDENTVNHIAAGEVVERYASVVKELAENSLDADSSFVKIGVFADKNSITKISITDNGFGMSPEDAVLAFGQHATSKITAQSDLNEISTLGFRGEALASIAAVSKVTLVTKERGSLEGTKVVINGGELRSCEAAGAPEGTSVIVEDLFFNTPARKKFQKKLPTELSHLYDAVERLALSHKDVAFVLTYNDKERFRTYGSGNAADVISEIFGDSLSKNLTEVSDKFSDINVTGYVSKPGSELRNQASGFYLSVNSRQIASNRLQWAVREGYGTLLASGKYPYAFLNIEMSPLDVDVNVHPTKKEVRFSYERTVMTAVQNAVYNALHDEIHADFESSVEDSKPKPEAPVKTLDSFVTEPGIAYFNDTGASFNQNRRTDIQLSRTREVESSGLRSDNADLRISKVISQIGGTYILAENEDGDLVIIDQHAAHERIMYDLLLKRRGVGGQELLVPLPLKLTRKEAAAVSGMLDVLSAAGYVLEPFGEDEWVVRSVPVLDSRLGEPEVVRDIIAETMGYPPADKEKALDRVLKTAACRAVVKGNTPLSLDRMERLVGQLAATDSPYTCPHGRPTFIVLGKEKLAKMFLR